MDEQREYPFEFSVVMAVYNVEPFLREAVDSLIQQDFGFERIQLIMVDDGSTDGSGVICDEYARQYPKNMLAIHKENGGASSARNAGVKLATGRYLNFMDPDDIIDKNVFSSVYQFFAEHGDETDVVSVPMLLFGERRGEHWANNKFNQGSRVIDLEKDWQFFQMSLASAFLKAKVAKELCFQENLVMAIAEDAKELIKIFLHRPTLGVVVNGHYHYRQRNDSQVKTSREKSLTYIPYLKDFSSWVIQYAVERVGCVPKYIQFIVMYDLQWRINTEKVSSDILSEGETESYISLLKGLFAYIDDDVVLAQRYITPERKVWVLEQKYGKQAGLMRWRDNALLTMNNEALYALAQSKLRLDFLKIKEGMCILEGYATIYPAHLQDVSIHIVVNGKRYPCTLTGNSQAAYTLGEAVSYRAEFQTSFPLLREDEKYNIKVVVTIAGIEIENKNFEVGAYFPVGQKYVNAYYFKDDWKITIGRGNLQINSCGKKGRIISELKFLKELWKRNALGGRKAVLARLLYHIQRRFKRKQIWLISDKAQRADDNGEVFFKYVNEQHDRNIKSYFIIGKGCADYLRMQKIGKVVGYLTWKHKRLLLQSDYIISAYSHKDITSPFANIEPYRDILSEKRFVFLQHGIIYNNVSGGLGRRNRNVFRFITSTEQEREYIASPLFGYCEEEVWLTGLPRFDRLGSKDQRQIYFMPTWRKFLTKGFEAKEDRWVLANEFEKSEYFRCVTQLMNNKRLLHAAKELNYTIHFVPHPVWFPYIEKFCVDRQVSIHGSECKYYEMFNSGSLLITDYSSLAFDFAYLRKPILYWQFDKKRFYSDHGYSQGYYDIERDGFGEVEYDLESIVDRIIEYMENGCQLKEKYRERINKFFAFNDQNNCQRVYEKIMELEGKGKA